MSRIVALRCLTAAVLVTPLLSVFAASPANFAIWKSAELEQRDAALSKKVGPDHSARETLADYKDHRFRMLYRDADGFPEQHDNIIDVVIVRSGEGALLLGGTMINPKASNAGEYVGTAIEGGERHPLAAADVYDQARGRRESGLQRDHVRRHARPGPGRDD